jgi:RNA polymerase sigma factor (sigma-70 family)
MTSSTDTRDDFALLDAWADGDHAAARELMRRYTGPLMRFFDRKLEGPIEDLVQDTLLACIKGRHDFRREAGFRSYVFGIARHVLFAALRAKHRAAAIDVEVSRLVDLEPTPSRIIAQKHEMRVLLDALRRLPLETQVLLELYHWQKLSGPELATLLGIGERALRSRLHRAMLLLREAVAEVAESPELLSSSLADFDSWAQGLPKPRDSAESEDPESDEPPAP